MLKKSEHSKGVLHPVTLCPTPAIILKQVIRHHHSKVQEERVRAFVPSSILPVLESHILIKGVLQKPYSH